MEKEGALVKIEDHDHNVGTCYRCGTTVEPRVSKQWFVKMKPLAGPAIDAVKEGKTKFVPEHFNKTYFHWLENIRDWCISRQLWWGHQIPAFYCDDCGELVVTKENSAVCPKCGKPMRQDPDTLDTWFSSALWPFSTLGWPDKTEEMDYFYPTNTLVTGYDIIPFWVMRMMFSGLEHTGQVPFDTVLIHGLVRDSQGRKMSKSLGNGIDPLEVIDKYGADALRLHRKGSRAPGVALVGDLRRVCGHEASVHRRCGRAFRGPGAARLRDARDHRGVQVCRHGVRCDGGLACGLRRRVDRVGAGGLFCGRSTQAGATVEPSHPSLGPEGLAL